MRRALPCSAVFVLSLAGGACPSQVAVTCKGEACGPAPSEEAPRFFADPPFGIGYDCVTIGCATDRPLVLENRGGGKLGISLVRTTVDSSSDFAIVREGGGPLPVADEQGATHVLLGGGEKLTLLVRYAPTDGLLDQGTVEVEHYDASLAYLDAAPQVERLPLTARALGSAIATMQVPVLDFGFVPIGSSATLELVVDNTGEESVLAVGPVDRELATSPAFHPPAPRDWGESLANSGASVRVPVVFTPTSADAFFGTLIVSTNDPLQPIVRVQLQGTAIPTAQLAVIDPIPDLVLAPMRAGETRTGTVTVRNIGGAPLDVSALISEGAAQGLTVAPAEIVGLLPLATATLEVTLNSSRGGVVNGDLSLSAADGGLVVPIVGEVLAPLTSVSPSQLNLGEVVQGWSATPRQLSISNTGFGELTITAIAFEVGSSSQIQVIDVPPLPLKLSPGDPAVVLTIVMTAGSLGPSDAVLLVSSDSVDNDVRRVIVHGDVITCEEGCPTPHGTPSCVSGFCEIGTCLQGFHDADLAISSGCECGEDIDAFNNRADISQACGGRNLGVLHDTGNPEQLDVTGSLHSLDDVDLFFFDANDESQLFESDDFGVRVEILNGPAGLQICANIQGDGAGCGGLPNNCSSTAIANTNNDLLSNSKDVTIFVKWAPGAAPQCGNYTIRVRANAG